MDENKYISTQVITISENNEYKKTMNKNIHNTFAKYLKHPFLSTVSYSKVLQLKYDKEFAIETTFNIASHAYIAVLSANGTFYSEDKIKYCSQNFIDYLYK